MFVSEKIYAHPRTGWAHVSCRPSTLRQRTWRIARDLGWSATTDLPRLATPLPEKTAQGSRLEALGHCLQPRASSLQRFLRAGGFAPDPLRSFALFQPMDLHAMRRHVKSQPAAWPESPSNETASQDTCCAAISITLRQSVPDLQRACQACVWADKDDDG